MQTYVIFIEIHRSINACSAKCAKTDERYVNDSSMLTKLPSTKSPHQTKTYVYHLQWMTAFFWRNCYFRSICAHKPSYEHVKPQSNLPLYKQQEFRTERSSLLYHEYPKQKNTADIICSMVISPNSIFLFRVSGYFKHFLQHISVTQSQPDLTCYTQSLWAHQKSLHFLVSSI